MALWGTADAVYTTGTISVDLANKTITGAAALLLVHAGDVITIGAYGEAVISEVTSDTLVSIATTQHLSETVAGETGWHIQSHKTLRQLLAILTTDPMIFSVSIGEVAYVFRYCIRSITLVGLVFTLIPISMELRELCQKFLLL